MPETLPGIFIEAKPVQDIEFADHMYLVYRDELGNEWVIRSGRGDGGVINADMEFQINVPIDESKDARGDDTPEDRHSTQIDLGDMSADEAWAIMVRYARAFEADDYDYNAFGPNSNSLVGALLTAVGLDPEPLIPEGADNTVGFEDYTDMLADIAPPENGDVLGTNGNDLIEGIQIDEVMLGLNGRDTINGADGNDTISGGDGKDRMSGGAEDDHLSGNKGRDRLFGEDGDDTLSGGSRDDLLSGGRGRDLLIGGNGDDKLKGGNGRDTLKGGSGDDVLLGGGGADQFVFEPVTGDDTIRDFEEGDLIVLQITEFADFDAVTAASDVIDGDTVITGSSGTIRVEDTILTEDDFWFTGVTV